MLYSQTPTLPTPRIPKYLSLARWWPPCAEETRPPREEFCKARQCGVMMLATFHEDDLRKNLLECSKWRNRLGCGQDHDLAYVRNLSCDHDRLAIMMTHDTLSKKKPFSPSGKPLRSTNPPKIMAPTYKLRHPDARGRGEPMRIMLVCCGKLEVRSSPASVRACACLLPLAPAPA